MTFVRLFFAKLQLLHKIIQMTLNLIIYALIKLAGFSFTKLGFFFKLQQGQNR